MSYFDFEKMTHEQDMIRNKKQAQKEIYNKKVDEYKSEIMHTFDLFSDIAKEYSKLCQIYNRESVSVITRITRRTFFGGEKVVFKRYDDPINYIAVDPGCHSHEALFAVNNAGELLLVQPQHEETFYNGSRMFITYCEVTKCDHYLYKEKFNEIFDEDAKYFYQGMFDIESEIYDVKLGNNIDDDPWPMTYMIFILTLASYHIESASFSNYNNYEEFKKKDDREKEILLISEYAWVTFRGLKSDNERIESLKNILIRLSKYPYGGWHFTKYEELPEFLRG